MTPQETDLALDRTLRGLGHVNPSTGFTGRLQTRLAQHTATPSASPNRVFLTPLRQVLALSLAALLCTVTVLRSHTRTVNFSTPFQSKRAAEPNSPDRLRPTLHAKQPPVSGVQTPALANSVASAETGPATLRTSPRDAAQASRPSLGVAKAPASAPILSPELTSTTDAQALADFHAPSFPAPPWSLTPQERLVALMLRQGEKHDLAELDSSETSAFLATERAAFQHFFEPATPSNHQENAIESASSPAIPQP